MAGTGDRLQALAPCFGPDAANGFVDGKCVQAHVVGESRLCFGQQVCQAEKSGDGQIDVCKKPRMDTFHVFSPPFVLLGGVSKHDFVSFVMNRRFLDPSGLPPRHRPPGPFGRGSARAERSMYRLSVEGHGRYRGAGLVGGGGGGASASELQMAQSRSNLA